MNRMKNIISSNSEYTESFYGFRGIAPLGDTSVKNRLAYCENVFRNYDSNTSAAIESVPGYREVGTFGSEINGIHSDGELYVHADGELLRLVFGNDPQEVTVKSVGSLRNSRSHSFCFGGSLYLTDGEKFYRIKRGADATEEVRKYVPTLFQNGKPFEQRSLLTREFTEEYDIFDARSNVVGTRGLKYSITDADLLLCGVSGADEDVSGELDIPEHTLINGIEYRVKEISANAFSGNQKITRVRISEGIEKIGPMAFYGCPHLTAVTTPRSLVEIESSALGSCLALTDVYLRSGLEFIDNAAFVGSYNLSCIHFDGSEYQLQLIDGISQVANINKSYFDVDTSINATFGIYSSPESISRVSVGGNEVQYRILYNGEAVIGISLELEKHWQHNGERLIIEGVLPELRSDFNGTGEEGEVEASEAILGCTVSAIYDGRVFLAGNPRLPNTVFYAARDRSGRVDPTYFGEYNYFNDGSGSSCVTSLLAIGDSLAVFKEGDDGDGSIFYHKAYETGEDIIPTVYPVSSIHAGIEIYGRAVSFMDEAVFLSPSGLMAIEKQQINYERSIVCRSSNVNAYLLGCDLKRATLARFMGYLAVACGEYIFLADPRATFVGNGGNLEYEWFIIKGVGLYSGKESIYRYDSSPVGTDLSVKEEAVGEIFTGGSVYSTVINDRMVYFSREETGAYALYKTDEVSYESFSAAEEYFSYPGGLYFKHGGKLFTFNDDLDGIMPQGDTAPEEADIYMGRLHPSFYTFDGIIPRYVIKTVRTYCGVPHLTKSTVRNSLVIKYGGVSDGTLTCEVGTDKSGYTECAKIYGTGLSFAELDFSNLSLSPPLDITVPIGEREKGWVEKDITLYSNGEACPIAVYSIAYRYKIKGRIKKG